MFAEIAAKLRAMGWNALIPLVAGQKRPAIGNWNHYNKQAPSDAEVARWMRLHAMGGIGLAFGPDKVIGIDLDWTDPDLARRGWDITKSIVGETPLVRVGKPPKRLALYRASPGLVVDGKAFPGFDIFSKSGQCVLFGIHPDTGKPYHWISETPETVGPCDLPQVDSEHVTELIGALITVDPSAARTMRKGVARIAMPGIASDVLRAFREAKNVPAEAAIILAAAPVGKRHNTLVGCAIALAMRGYPDRVIFDALDSPYYAVNDLEMSKAQVEVENAVKWAREQVGPDDSTIAKDLAPAIANITKAWNRRWARE